MPPLLQHFEEGLRQPAGQQLDHDPQQVDAVELRCFQTGRHCWLALSRTREDCHLQRQISLVWLRGQGGGGLEKGVGVEGAGGEGGGEGHGVMQ